MYTEGILGKLVFATCQQLARATAVMLAEKQTDKGKGVKTQNI